MGHIISLSPEAIRELIVESNRVSAQGSQQYLVGENRAIRCDYEFINCPCQDDCWCRRNGCTGHYRLKNEVTFDDFLATYLTLWIPPRARSRVRSAVLEGTPFNGHQRNSVAPLRWLQENWSSIVDKVRSYDKCGLCDPTIDLEVYVGSRYEVSNLYAGKMWAQLFYDSLVPFDWKSRARIKRAGYSDPATTFFLMNRELFRDLRRVSEDHRLDVPTVRCLDLPHMVIPELWVPVGGQPLSRVLDKIFYSP